ncbi:MAG: DUF721 domain-containing protein [Hyphomicrobiales bacterium]|nr:DUF721 domain-containing protein [Hyphomicrobiales bacterium]
MTDTGRPPAPRKPAPPPRRGKVRALAEAVDPVTRPLFRKRGLAEGAVATEWERIVGPVIARHCLPERIAYSPRSGEGGTLHLRVDSGAIALELQHLEPQLVERVNGYFGYRAVERVTLIQGPLPRRPEPPAPPRALEAGEERALAAELDQVADPELRAALERLGRSLRARGPAPDRP